VCNGAMHGRPRAQNRLEGVYARLRRAMAPLHTLSGLAARFCAPEAGEAGTKLRGFRRSRANTARVRLGVRRLSGRPVKPGDDSSSFTFFA
jgi:hypothetical protein